MRYIWILLPLVCVLSCKGFDVDTQKKLDDLQTRYDDLQKKYNESGQLDLNEALKLMSDTKDFVKDTQSKGYSFLEIVGNVLFGALGYLVLGRPLRLTVFGPASFSDLLKGLFKAKQ